MFIVLFWNSRNFRVIHLASLNRWSWRRKKVLRNKRTQKSCIIPFVSSKQTYKSARNSFREISRTDSLKNTVLLFFFLSLFIHFYPCNMATWYYDLLDTMSTKDHQFSVWWNKRTFSWCHLVNLKRQIIFSKIICWVQSLEYTSISQTGIWYPLLIF